jgi:hypothetical protein
MFVLVGCLTLSAKQNNKFASSNSIQTTISDLIQIKPKELRKPTEEALEDNINIKYANRVRLQTVLPL